MERDYKSPAAAIVIQAAKDYYNALYWLKKNKDADHDGAAWRHKNAMKLDCELFFRSHWCKQLTDIPGEKMIKTIRKRVMLKE